MFDLLIVFTYKSMSIVSLSFYTNVLCNIVRKSENNGLISSLWSAVAQLVKSVRLGIERSLV